MTALAAHAQLEQLATLLEVDVERLRDLERLGADGLKRLRTAISARLFDGENEMFRRVSKLAPLVPDALVAKVAQAAVPALVSGRLAGALGIDHTERAAGLLRRMRADYLADAAPHLDPRAIAVLAPEFDVAPDALVPTARVLLARGEYATAAAFLAFATPALIRAFAAELDDLEALRAALAYVDEDTLTEVARHVPTARWKEIQGAETTDRPARPR